MRRGVSQRFGVPLRVDKIIDYALVIIGGFSGAPLPLNLFELVLQLCNPTPLDGASLEVLGAALRTARRARRQRRPERQRAAMGGGCCTSRPCRARRAGRAACDTDEVPGRRGAEACGR